MRVVLVAISLLVACGGHDGPAKGVHPTEAEAVRFYGTIEAELRGFEAELAGVLGDHAFRCGQTNDPEKLSTLIAAVSAWVPSHQPRSATWIEIEFDCGGKGDQSLYTTTWVGGRGGNENDQGPDVKLSWGIFAASKTTVVGINAVTRRIKSPEKVSVSAYYAMP